MVSISLLHWARGLPAAGGDVGHDHDRERLDANFARATPDGGGPERRERAKSSGGFAGEDLFEAQYISSGTGGFYHDQQPLSDDHVWPTLQLDYCVGFGIGRVDCGEVHTARSEEHTSELQ